MNVQIARAAVLLCALYLAGPALAQDVTAAMHSQPPPNVQFSKSVPA